MLLPKDLCLQYHAKDLGAEVLLGPARRCEISWGRAAQSGPALAKVPKCLISTAMKSCTHNAASQTTGRKSDFLLKITSNPSWSFLFGAFYFSNSQGSGWLSCLLLSSLWSEQLPDLRHISQRLCLHRPYAERAMLRRPLRAEFYPVQLEISQAFLSPPANMIKT